MLTKRLKPRAAATKTQRREKRRSHSAANQIIAFISEDIGKIKALIRLVALDSSFFLYGALCIDNKGHNKYLYNIVI